jgi:hypothetical protein
MQQVLQKPPGNGREERSGLYAQCQCLLGTTQALRVLCGTTEPFNCLSTTIYFFICFFLSFFLGRGAFDHLLGEGLSLPARQRSARSNSGPALAGSALRTHTASTHPQLLRQLVQPPHPGALAVSMPVGATHVAAVPGTPAGCMRQSLEHQAR